MILATLHYSNAQPILVTAESMKVIYRYLFKTEMKPETIKFVEIDDKTEILLSEVTKLVKVEPDPPKEMIWETGSVESEWEDGIHYIVLDDCAIKLKGDNVEIDKIIKLIKQNTKDFN